VGVRLAVVAVAALVAGSPAANGVRFVQAHELDGGAYAETGGRGDPLLTAWATLGIRATNTKPPALTSRYFEQHEGELRSATDISLVALAEAAVAQTPDRLIVRLRRLERPTGSFGGLVNGTAWAVMALKATGSAVHAKTIRWLLARQSRNGGWGWTAGAADSNDTAAAIEALRAAGARGSPVRRGLRFLATYRNRDGGFELTRGRGSDAQSTAWAVQAYLAAGRQPPRGALAYLRSLQRPDGSFRYSHRYATTPVWVTAQVLPALARKPFPLR
jgi:Prenyltransferase and squalene oxidase repeat